MEPLGCPSTAPAAHSLRLRILATSDLHMQLRSFDYIKAQDNDAASLAKLASLIRTNRNTANNDCDICLLVDNGDTWQGNPLADFLANHKPADTHPMASAMNHLGYDAIGIGNHDFDFGIDYLRSCLGQLAAPAVCSNIRSPAPPRNKPHTALGTRPTPPRRQ